MSNKSSSGKPCGPTSTRRCGAARLNNVKLTTGEDTNPSSMKIVKRKEEHLKISTWNVRGLNKPGKLENVMAEATRLKINILGLSEIKLTDSGNICKERFTLYYTGNPAHVKSNYHGVGFLIENELNKYVSNVIHFSNRCMMIKLNAHPFNLNILQLYAPTAESDDQEIEQFYEGVNEVLKSVKSQEIVIVMGDLNAKVGEGEVEDIVGKFGLAPDGNAWVHVAPAHLPNTKVTSKNSSHNNLPTIRDGSI
ncbi:hypothetical protein ACJJTC_016247 [Scirpophaga incertulas]